MRTLRRLDAFDRRLFHLLTRREQVLLDRGLKTLTTTANRSVLWLSISTVLAVAGGDRGRRAALRGLLAISLTSTLVNLPLKYVARRARPSRRRGDRPPALPIPGSFSFPSGHSASAFAFTTAIAREDPRLLLFVLPLAGAVAYSRVHLRVHYPFDVVAGAAIGTGVGLSANAVIKAGQEWRDARTPAPVAERPETNQLVLITSPNAGKSKEKLERARKALSEAGLQVVEEFGIEEISRLDEIINRSDRPPIAVAAGGDGTVGAVSNALVGTSGVLGVLPLGSSNDFARSLDLPMRIEHAARLLAVGKVSTIDAGRLQEDGKAPRQFVHAATAGLNVNFARLATRADLRHRLGRLTYAVAGVLALRERPTFDCELIFEDGIRTRRLEQLSVINTAVIGGALGFKVPGADPNSRKLQLLLVEHLPIRRLLQSAINNLVGRPQLVRGVTLQAVRRVTVSPDKTMDVALDGEICGKIPGTFEVVPDGLRVITRARYGVNA